LGPVSIRKIPNKFDNPEMGYKGPPDSGLPFVNDVKFIKETEVKPPVKHQVIPDVMEWIIPGTNIKLGGDIIPPDGESYFLRNRPIHNSIDINYINPNIIISEEFAPETLGEISPIEKKEVELVQLPGGSKARLAIKESMTPDLLKKFGEFPNPRVPLGKGKVFVLTPNGWSQTLNPTKGVSGGPKPFATTVEKPLKLLYKSKETVITKVKPLVKPRKGAKYLPLLKRLEPFLLRVQILNQTPTQMANHLKDSLHIMGLEVHELLMNQESTWQIFARRMGANWAPLFELIGQEYNMKLL